jgi:phage terminase small subunit
MAQTVPQSAKPVELSMPPGMGDKAKWLWRFVTDHCQGYLGKADEPALRVLCEVYEVYRRQLKEDPEASLKTAEKWYRMCAQFGMTPVDRAKLNEKQHQGKDERKPDERAARFLAG